LTPSGRDATLAAVLGDSKLSPDRDATLSTPRGGYLLAMILAASLISLPFLAVRFPPVTDLPQQAAQVRLFLEYLDGSQLYALNLAAPGTLGYGVFGLSWLLAGEENAGRLAYLLLGILWVAALAVTARSYRRSPTLVPLASLFFFSHLLYWGFFGFLFGAALFLLWIALERRLRATSSQLAEILLLTISGIALYAAHLFWFLIATAFLLVVTFRSNLPTRRRWLRLAGFTPGLLLLGLWAPRIAASGFESETLWWNAPWARLGPGEMTNRFLGGIHGPVEPVILISLGLWLAIGLWQHRADLRSVLEPELLWLGASMIVLSLLLPDRHQNTLHFAGRWTPIGAGLLLLALPPPRIRKPLRWLVALVLLASLSVTSLAAWKRFEHLELAGLEDSLRALPPNSSLLGLDYYRLSQFVKTQPFFQIPAYGQALSGGSLGFSFASFPASPVVFREWENPPWTPGLEWLPHEIFESLDDLLYFDFVLIHADEPGQLFFERQPSLTPLTPSARWRLYRVVPSVPADSRASIQ